MKSWIHQCCFMVILFQACSESEQVPPEEVPFPPTDLTAIGVSDSQIDLAWTNVSTNLQGSKIERKTGQDSFSEIATVDADTEIYSDTNLDPQTSYEYRLYAYNSGGKSLTYSNQVNATTLKSPVPVQLSTISITTIGSASAFGGGTIISDGFPEILTQGVVWSTTANPTVALNTKTTDEKDAGIFNSVLTGLEHATKYYVRAYATNAIETAYGNELTFVTRDQFFAVGSGVTDVDGNNYTSVILGNQEWLAENLRTAKYSNGEDIPNGANQSWNGLSTDAWIYYENNDQNNGTFGKLYNWYAVSDSRNLCPSDWHVPDMDEWMMLLNYLGGSNVAGGRMKSAGEWWAPNMATNESGFNGLPAGDINFNPTGFRHTLWWSSTVNAVNSEVSYIMISDHGPDISLGAYKFTGGFSVRCVKD